MQIENSSNTLTQLLETVREQASRSADYLAPTDALQFKTRDTGGEHKTSSINLLANCALTMSRLTKYLLRPELTLEPRADYATITVMSSKGWLTLYGSANLARG